MTVTEIISNGHGSTLPDDEQKRRAREAFRASGGKLSGRQLAEMFDRPAKWGQRRRAEVLSERALSADTPPKPAADTKARPTTDKPRTAPARTRTPTVRRRDPWQVACTGVVLAVGLAVSYSHIVHLALLAGGGWWAWVMPLPLDGMALVSIRHLSHERRYWVAWAGVAIGATGSLTANVLAMDPTLADMRYVRWGFAALPPIAVVLCGHLLDRGNR